MIILRTDTYAAVVSYRLLSRWLEVWNLSMIQVSDADEHYHAVIDSNNNLIGTVNWYKK